jgi:hypothetical protein
MKSVWKQLGEKRSLVNNNRNAACLLKITPTKQSKFVVNQKTGAG